MKEKTKKTLKSILESCFFVGMLLAGVSVFMFIFASSVISLIHVGLELNETTGTDVMSLVSIAVRRNTIFLLLFIICFMGYFIMKRFIPIIKNARRNRNN